MGRNSSPAVCRQERMGQGWDSDGMRREGGRPLPKEDKSRRALLLVGSRRPLEQCGGALPRACQGEAVDFSLP